MTYVEFNFIKFILSQYLSANRFLIFSISKLQNFKQMNKDILLKAQNLCVKKEICIWDIKMKQQKWELNDDDIEDIIEQLVGNNFINEQRYSKAFASDKFNFNKWGRIKIRYELSKRNISQNNINKALEQIDETNYISVLQTLLEKKANTKLPLGNDNIIRQKLVRFAIGKGFEPEIVYKLINKIV